MAEQDNGPPRKRDQRVEAQLKDLQELFQAVTAGRSEHLKFNLYNFDFFRKSERGEAILFFGRSRALTLLIALPYIVGSELAFFRGKRFFVKLKERVVGIFVLREKQDALYVGSLGVASEYREQGIGTYIIDYCTKIASRLDKDWLELTVLKTNTLARRLYQRTGFFKKEERKWSLVLRKKVTSNSNSSI